MEIGLKGKVSSVKCYKVLYVGRGFRGALGIVAFLVLERVL